MPKIHQLKYITILILYSCNPPENKDQTTEKEIPDTVASTTRPNPQPPQPSPLEQRLITAGLVNIQDLDTTIAVDLKYSTEDNFIGIDMYGDLTAAYFQPDVATMLITAQKLLHRRKPDYHLLIYDGVRPRSVQQIMWDSVKVPSGQKWKYVSNPSRGSVHNYGAAVDLTLSDENGHPLDMGTPYDYFGEEAHPPLEQQLLKEGKLSDNQVNNRNLLREIMKEAGFRTITSEWWHFNACSREEAKKRYTILE